MKFLGKHLLLTMAIILIIACASVIALAYFYLKQPPWAQNLYKQTPPWAQQLYRQAKAQFRCTPPMIEQPFEVKVEELLAGQQFDKAVQLRLDTQNSAIWYVGEHQGKIFKIENGTKTAFLDLTNRVKSGGQWGLQGFALHPDFPRNPRIAVSYTAFPPSPDLGLESRLSVFFGNRDEVDVKSELILLHNQQKDVWHPIAGLEFAPDGNLLVGWGEGSGSHPQSLGGKLLRINIDKVTSSTTYRIPDDNPFRNRNFLPEVFASGFRNPWRFSVDRQTNEIWVGDVGSRHFEEVNVIKPGQHYGWPEFEGTRCIKKPCKSKNTEPLTLHPNSSFAAVIGGYFYRGKIDSLRDKYVYGSVRGGLWAFDKKTAKSTQITYALPGDALYSFAIDQFGEIMFIAFEQGDAPPKETSKITKIYKIVDVIQSPHSKSDSDDSLAELGCAGSTLKRAHMAYEISSPKWESGLKVRRYAPRELEKQKWHGRPQRPFGRDLVLIRELYFEDRPIETQMIAYNHGIWQTFAFAWNDAGNDATLVQEPIARQLPNGDIWTHRSPAQCQQCHNTRAGWLLGYRFSQLDRPVERRGNQINQLDYWVKQGVIKEIPEKVRTNPMPDPTDESVSTVQRARAYLDVNCSSCHQKGGMAQHVGIDLARTSSLRSMGLCRMRRDHFFINPHAPSQSLIIKRMRDSAFPMPPDRTQVDQNGLRLVENWIKTLSNCPK